MSIIIELNQDRIEREHSSVDKILVAVFKDPIFSCVSYLFDKSKHFFLKQSGKTYRLATKWEFAHLQSFLNLQIRFYTKKQDTYLRAISERSKLETSILLRMYENLMPENQISMETDSGILQFRCFLPYQELHFQAFEKLKVFFLNIFQLFWRLDELISFVEVGSYQSRNQSMSSDIYEKINKYRSFLKNTKNRRDYILSLYNQISYGKKLPQVSEAHLNELRRMFHNNVVAFHESQIGLTEADLNLDEEHEKDIRIESLKSGKFTTESNKKNKIVNGIKIVEWKKQKRLSQGTHCVIFVTKLKYEQKDTIYCGTMAYNQNNEEQSNCKSQDLTYKICRNYSSQPSVNSFKNQLKVLQYLRDQKCPYIGKYFLQLKEEWSEKDRIFMKKYKCNLYELFQNHSSSIGIFKKIKMAYQAGRALCFLSSKEIIHRDFKPYNIVVDKSLKIHVIDFGSSAPHHNSPKLKVHDQRLLTASICHVRWNNLKPEDKQIIQSKYDGNSYNKHRLFDAMGFGRVISYIFFGDVNLPPIQKLQNEPFYEILENIYFMVQLCLKVDPDDRPGYSELTAFLECLLQLLPNHHEEDQIQFQNV